MPKCLSHCIFSSSVIPAGAPPLPPNPSHPYQSLNWHRQHCNSNPFTVMGMWVGYTGTVLTLQGFTARRKNRAWPPYFTQIFIDLLDSKRPLLYEGHEEEGCLQGSEVNMEKLESERCCVHVNIFLLQIANSSVRNVNVHLPVDKFSRVCIQR